MENPRETNTGGGQSIFGDDAEAPFRGQEPDEPFLREVFTILRLRSKQLRRSAAIYLAVIAFAIAGGLLLYVQAEVAVGTDQTFRMIDAAQEAVQSAAKRLNEDRERVIQFHEEEQSENSKRSSTRTSLDEVRVAKSEVQFERALEHLSKLQLAVATQHPDRWPGTVAGIWLRAGVILLTGVLTQLLLGLYRYNLRMAAFYDGRADALLLLSSGASRASYGELVELLSGTTVRFGTEPKMVPRDIVDLVRAVSGK